VFRFASQAVVPVSKTREQKNLIKAQDTGEVFPVPTNRLKTPAMAAPFIAVKAPPVSLVLSRSSSKVV